MPHNRQIAHQAARCVYLYAAQVSSEATWALQAQGLAELDARLLAEANATDKWTCSREEMLVLLRAEHARVKGQSLGGCVTAVKRRAKKRLAAMTS